MKWIIYRDSKLFIQHHLWKLFMRCLADCLDLPSPVQTAHFYHSVTSHCSIQSIFSEYNLTFFPISKQSFPSLLWSSKDNQFIVSTSSVCIIQNAAVWCFTGGRTSAVVTQHLHPSIKKPEHKYSAWNCILDPLQTVAAREINHTRILTIPHR